MDLKQLEYMIAIGNEQSISRAAEKLFVTQSALNQQLLKLEKELGTPLFERRHHLMIPTFAGRLYLTTARQMISMKKDTYKIIRDISEDNVGEISVAYTPERGSMMFAYIYPYFHKKYPNVSFKIYEARVKQLELRLLHQDVTLAQMTYSNDFKMNPAFEAYDIGQEYMILGIPASHRLAHLGGENSAEKLPEIDLTLFKNDQFVLMSHETRFRDMIDLAFSVAGYSPKILLESTNSFTIFNMVRQQIAPAFFPQSYVDPNAPIVYFTTRPRQYWMRSFAYLKGTYLTHPEKYFLELAKQYTAGTLDNLNS